MFDIGSEKFCAGIGIEIEQGGLKSLTLRNRRGEA
jgi:hypothetical protein